MLVEAADAQRQWCQEVHTDKGQFNVLPEALAAGWRSIAFELLARSLLEATPTSSSEGRGAQPTSLTLAIAAQGVRHQAMVAANGELPVRSWYEQRAGGFIEEEGTAVYMASVAAKAASAVSTASARLPVHVQLLCIDKLTPADLREREKPTSAIWKLYPWEA